MTAIPKALKPCFGADPLVPDPWVKLCYRMSSSLTRAYYPKSTDVDTAIFQHQMVLNSATAPFIYSKFSPTRIPWKKGSRPRLERLVDRLVMNPKMARRDKVLRLLRFCRDIPRSPRVARRNYGGGTEEEIIDQSTDMCNEMNRVFMVLCQIAGFPSRYVGHFGCFLKGSLKFEPGHAVAEVFVENSWAYFDIRGKYFVWPDGSLATTWDLLTNRALYDHQPASVRALQDPRRAWSETFKYDAPEHLTVIANFTPALCKTFTYNKVSRDVKSFRLNEEHRKQIRQEFLKKIKAL